jgi:hypothetical protein
MLCRTPLEWVWGVPFRRPRLDVTKEARVDVRMHAALREALEQMARAEGRTLSQLCERQLRLAVIEYLKATGKDARSVETLP